MTSHMKAYVEALNSNAGIKLPPIMLKENIKQMKNIERLFEGKVRKLQGAIARKDLPGLEECISDLEMVIENARQLLEKVKSYETDK